MRNLILGLSLSAAFIVGCLVRPFVVPPVRAGTNPQKWEYKCFHEYGAKMVERTEVKANRLGNVGFEWAGVGGSDGSVFCFKRRLP